MNEIGIAQARSLCNQLQGVKFAAVYSSPLLRARQTGELVAHPLGLHVTLEPRLREMNLGEWEGLSSKELEAKYPDELAERARNPFPTRAPRGESPREVGERVLTAFHEIARRYPDDRVLIFSHGIALATVICQSRGLRREEVYQHVPENAQPYRVQCSAAKLIHFEKIFADRPAPLLVPAN